MTGTLLFFLMGFQMAFAGGQTDPMVIIPEGTYRPFVLKSKAKKGEKGEFQSIPVSVKKFLLDRDVVTEEQFLQFVTKHPEWRKSQVPSLFADSHYLKSWKSDLQLSESKAKRKPVTSVSWFAAKAYCESEKKTLPTTDQWEYALFDQGRNSEKLKEKTLEWYSLPNSHQLSDVGTDLPNGFGLHDMSGLVWEWTLDFADVLSPEDLRDSDDKDSALFCGGGSLGKLSPDDYATFMRYSFRSSLKANYTTENLGFRCARELP